MGDGGAYFLGSQIAVISILISNNSKIISPIFYCNRTFLPFFFEIFFSVFRKILEKKNFFFQIEIICIC